MERTRICLRTDGRQDGPFILGTYSLSISLLHHTSRGFCAGARVSAVFVEEL